MSLFILLTHWGYQSCSHDWLNGWGLVKIWLDPKSTQIISSSREIWWDEKGFLSGMDSVVICWARRRTRQESFKLAHIFHIALIPESERIAHRRIQAGQTLRSILRGMVDVVKSSVSPAIGSYSRLLDSCFIQDIPSSSPAITRSPLPHEGTCLFSGPRAVFVTREPDA